MSRIVRSGAAVINRGWMHVDARKWVEPWAGWTEEKRAIEKLDSEFIIANAPKAPASRDARVLGRTHPFAVVADAYFVGNA